METFLYLLLGSSLLLGPLFFFFFYADSLFGYSKYSGAVYIISLAIGFFIWKPLVIITLAISWAIILISWGILLWQILFYKGD